jgi:hypothetical protein
VTNCNCTLRHDKDCSGCSFQASQSCQRGNRSRMAVFWVALPVFVATSFGSLTASALATGAWWPVPLHLLFWIFYYGAVELLLHCPHCPYWNDTDERITCLLHNRLPKPGGAFFNKLLRYNPAPYSRKEQLGLMSCNIYSLFFPLVIAAHGLHAAYGSSKLLGIVIATSVYIVAACWFVFRMRSSFCTQCLNFSCPMNTQPEIRVRDYLDKNPVLKQVWEDARRYPGSKR